MSDYLYKSKRYKRFPYTDLPASKLAYLHGRTVEMADTIVKLLERNGIRYSICGGTLLGAVKQKGFFPWDDDVDICVLNDDYGKMIDILCESLPCGMVCQCPRTEQKYWHGWTKVRDTASHVYPDIKTYKYNGVWVDLYRLFPLKYSEIEHSMAKEHYDYLNRRHAAGDITLKEMERRMEEANLAECLAASSVQSDDRSVYAIWSASRTVLEPEWCFPVRYYDFEGLHLAGFNNYDAYLISHYGKDYMALPKEADRRISIHDIKLIDC